MRPPTNADAVGVLGARRIPFDRIPIADIGPMFGADRQAMVATARRVREVCENIGFFYIKNHGVADELIARAVRQSARFFSLPLAETLDYDIGRRGVHRGYVPAGALTAGPDAKTFDLQQGYEVRVELLADDPDYRGGSKIYGPNLWPRRPPAFRQDIYGYFDAIRRLGHVVFKTFAITLGLPNDFFEGMIDKPMAQLRLICYPPQGKVVDDREIGVGQHYMNVSRSYGRGRPACRCATRKANGSRRRRSPAPSSSISAT